MAVLAVTAATYSGTIDGGGSVSLTVSDGGTAVNGIQLNVPNTGCGSLVVQYVGTLPITNGAFTYATSTVTLSGTFPSPGTAQGTFQARQGSTPCASPRAWSATAPGFPTPTPTPTATPIPVPQPAPDTTPPVVVLSGATSQRSGRTVTVGVTASEFGSATAGGTLIVRGRRHALGTATAQLAPNVTARLHLRVPAKTRRAAVKALRAHRHVSAQLTVTARDQAGNATTATRTVRLRRR
ncbi:hypothetical protein [Solirubrobacter soli]|uniref:hypothetical protein n=1 Tax=Solirubrobacter soli TaxID=363832 RepID=UPI0004199A33|nr:hypothetical protein [Solirubrobacter soli]